MTSVTALRQPTPAGAKATVHALPGVAPIRDGDLQGMLRILTCGSVDDGKSTLIGRLLWDATDLYDDQRETLQKGRKVGDGSHPDYSLLLDGLLAEREQGITIDIAWRYFDASNRRFVIIDSPGHEQYTRNMASGASHADVAIMLVDARHGIKRQTRRHTAILDLVGVKRVILAVNKMDLVDWNEARYRKIEADFRSLTWRFGFWEALAIPVGAVTGDNVASRSPNMPWYRGPHLLEHLEQITSRVLSTGGPFRFPVQSIVREGVDFRGLTGTVSSGTVAVGDHLVDVLSGKSARVKRLVTMDRDLNEAAHGHAIVIQLDTDIDVARGAVLAKPDSKPTVARSVEARFVWLNEAPFDPLSSYLLRTATDLIPISSIEIHALLDLETLASHPATHCGVNDIAVAHINLGRRAALDTFLDAPGTGNFLLVDAVTGASMAGGVISALSGDAHRAEGTFILTRAMLERGLCADLKDTPTDLQEFRRRANEAALILRAAGVAVEIESLQDWQI